MSDYKFRFPKIKDVLPIENGLFYHMNYDFGLDITKPQLDFLFLSQFAQRNPAPVIDMLHDEDEDEDNFSQLTDAELTTLAALMVNYFKPRWDKLGEIYEIEYDPIHNYLDDWEDEADGTKESENVLDSDRTDTINETQQHANLRTDNLSELETRDLGNGNTRTFNDTNKTEFNSSVTRSIDANDPMVEATLYGKEDEREDNLTRTNTGEDSTINSGTDTNSVWGFNSSNAVNSDSTTAGTTARHRIGDANGNNPLVEENTGTSTHTLSGTDTVTKTGTYSDEKDGDDSVKHTGTITDAGTETGTLTTANTGTQQNTGSDAITASNGRALDETTRYDDETHQERRGRHFGNIGNLTSQQMIKEEIELWKWSYIQEILNDARDFLTLSVYL